MPISTTTHKGQEITIIDFADLDEEGMIKLINDFADEVAQNKKEIKSLVKLGNATISNNFISAAKEVAPRYEEYDTKSAILGVTGIRNILLKGYNAVRKKPLVPFDNEAEALDYLVS